MRRALVVAALVITSACASTQDPGIAPPSSDGTVTTSRPLAPCPSGGPDATTPEAGCLDDDGSVLRP